MEEEREESHPREPVNTETIAQGNYGDVYLNIRMFAGANIVGSNVTVNNANAENRGLGLQGLALQWCSGEGTLLRYKRMLDIN
jgi:hypothetical protein